MTPAPHPDNRDESLRVTRSAQAAANDEHAPGHSRTSPEQQAEALEFAREVAQLLYDDRCEDVLVLDLRGHSQVTDFFVVASGTSQRQMRSAGLHAEELAKGANVTVTRTNLSDRDADWFIIDAVDVVVHLFEPETRLFYDIEMLWGDAKRVDWRRPDQKKDVGIEGDRNRAGISPDDVLPDEDE